MTAKRFGITDRSINHNILTPREMTTAAFENNQNARAADLKKARRRIKVDMPGYTGHIRGFAAGPAWFHYSGRFGQTFGTDGGTDRKHADVPFATPDNMYRKASARIKTNSKNHSGFILGDDRDRFWETTYLKEFTMPEGAVEYQKEPIHADWFTMEEIDRAKIYQRNYNFVGAEGTAELEKSIRTKIEQRTSGGPFALRKAFKYFDRDGSGDIDPDEFKNAMLHFGLTFTDRQVLAIFGTYDDDCSGSLDYYEFIDKVIESDYKSATGQKMSVRPRTPPRRTYPGQVSLYRQMIRLKEMFSFHDEDDTHTLSPDEIAAFLVESGHKEPDEEQVEEIMEILDRDKNGAISFEELWDWWVEYCLKSGKLQGKGLEVSEQFLEAVKAEARMEAERHLQRNADRVIHSTSPRELLRATQQLSPSTERTTPRPPPPRLRLPEMGMGQTMSLPSLPTSPGFKTMRPIKTARPTTQGVFQYGTQSKRGSFTPRCVGNPDTPKCAPKLSPLMRNRPLTHRGPETVSSGFKV